MGQFDFSFGSCYHIYQQGNHRQALFREDQDYLYFLDLFKKYLQPIADLFAYCLLPTHLHLLFRIKQKKQIEYVYHHEEMLGWQMLTLLRVYTSSRMQDSQEDGSLFNGGSTREIPLAPDLISKLVAYIHQNPQLYGVVSDFRFWPFSSCFAYARQDRRSLISKELLLDPGFQRKIGELQNVFGMKKSSWYE